MTFITNNHGWHFGIRRRDTCRRGFTLLEITLVLAVLITVGAMSLPYVEGWFDGSRLQQGADLTRTRWAEARTLAMNEGRTYRFQWLSSNQFRIAPDEADYWPNGNDNDVRTTQSSGNGSSAGTVVEEVLPLGVQFAGWQSGNTSVGQPALDAWSAKSIHFRPDGAARICSEDGMEVPEAILLLNSRQGGVTRLRLRALTGVVTVSRGGTGP